MNRSRKMATSMHFPDEGLEHIKCAEEYTERPKIDGRRGHSVGYGHHIESHGEKVEEFKNGVTRQETERPYEEGC